MGGRTPPRWVGRGWGVPPRRWAKALRLPAGVALLLLQPAVERLAVHAEDLGGAGLVATGLAEDFLDVGALQLAEGEVALGGVGDPAESAAGGADARRQVVGADLVGHGEGDRAVD